MQWEIKGVDMKNLWKDIKWLFRYMTSIVMYAIIVMLIGVGILLFAYFIDIKKNAANVKTPLYGAYVIVSGSMEPIIKIRDAVVTRRVDSIDDIAKGDVITYRAMDESYYGILITHRVVDIQVRDNKTLFVTKGDNNETVDRSPIEFGQITGKVIMRVPKVGYIKYFLVSSYGWLIAIVVPSLCIIGYDIFKLVRNIGKKREENEEEKERKVLKYDE